MRIIRNLSALVGFLLLLCTVSTSDYYVVELGQPEPSWIMRNLVIGFLLILPLVFHVVAETYAEWRDR